MADGSATPFESRVINVYDEACPTPSTLKQGQVVVGCCNRCATVGEVDVGVWRAQPRDAHAHLSVLKGELACLCGCRDVSLQVWPVEPEPATPRSQFYRWR